MKILLICVALVLCSCSINEPSTEVNERVVTVDIIYNGAWEVTLLSNNAYPYIYSGYGNEHVTNENIESVRKVDGSKGVMTAILYTYYLLSDGFENNTVRTVRTSDNKPIWVE